MQFNDKVYNVLKWVCLIAIPALITFLNILLPAVGVGPETVATVITVISASGAFIGALIGVSCVCYKKNE